MKKSNRNRKKQNVLDLGEIFSQLDVKAGTSGSASVHFGGGVQPVRETDQLKSGLSQRSVTEVKPLIVMSVWFLNQISNLPTSFKNFM